MVDVEVLKVVVDVGLIVVVSIVVFFYELYNCEIIECFLVVGVIWYEVVLVVVGL